MASQQEEIVNEAIISDSGDQNGNQNPNQSVLELEENLDIDLEDLSRQERQFQQMEGKGELKLTYIKIFK